jgi:hypothetical protein
VRTADGKDAPTNVEIDAEPTVRTEPPVPVVPRGPPRDYAILPEPLVIVDPTLVAREVPAPLAVARRVPPLRATIPPPLTAPRAIIPPAPSHRRRRIVIGAAALGIGLGLGLIVPRHTSRARDPSEVARPAQIEVPVQAPPPPPSVPAVAPAPGSDAPPPTGSDPRHPPIQPAPHS